ncbi:hypothetical protein BV898_13303 [Hypsibius exemplaris]|uniref:G-protein coupled receptors family 1 profile domain-containing protein n=1 Tax=Hypsibius exemplaris TaxID=2072580 RepID=A0A1W0WB82_HYPEX|nr:hypothetical protein BV898_13303 [Hypsibius exemplaris]
MNFSNDTIIQNATRVTLIPPAPSELLAWIIAELLTAGIGIVANAILLLAIITYAPLRQSSSSILIGHCILIDIYTCAIAASIAGSPTYLDPDHIYQQTQTFCRFRPLWAYLVYPAEAWATMLLALHRLVASLSPTLFGRLKTRRVISLFLALPWCASLSIVAWQVRPTAKYRMIPSANGGCDYQIGDPQAAFLSTLFGTYLPTAVAGTCYLIFIFKTLWDSRSPTIGQSVRVKRRLEISRTLMLSFVWHCVALYPVVIVVTMFSRPFAAMPKLRLGLRWLLDSLCALNPVGNTQRNHLNTNNDKHSKFHRTD